MRTRPDHMHQTFPPKRDYLPCKKTQNSHQYLDINLHVERARGMRMSVLISPIHNLPQVTDERPARAGESLQRMDLASAELPWSLRVLPVPDAYTERYW